MTDDWGELLDGWVPIRIHWDESTPTVEWCRLGARRFAEPFFDQTITESLRTPFNLLFRHRTPLAALAERHETRPGLAPDGFVFHMSRCGSTLVAQMLAALPENVVVSEAGPMDSILRARAARPHVTEAMQIDWLRWTMSALGQPRSGDERRFFVKFDSWSAIALPLVRRAFPDVPWIFLYRDPVDVLVSQFKRRSAHLVPGVVEAELFGLDDATVESMRPEAFCSHVLARICEACLDNADDPAALLVAYDELPDAVVSPVARLFGLDRDEGGLARMRARAAFDAKNPRLPFAESASSPWLDRDTLRRAAEIELIPLYERLEARRAIARSDAHA